MTELKPCKVCNSSRQKCYGIAVTSIDQLKIKGAEALGFDPGASFSLLLEEDGTIVEDQAYFLCLPANTKFMLLQDNEIWMHSDDGSLEYSSPQYAGAEAEGKDIVDGWESWRGLAELLRKDLASIILMSEANLQSLIDVSCSDLAPVLDFSQQKTQVLQDTLQRTLDRREEERQSKELLSLYLKAMEQEGSWEIQEESRGAELDETDGVQEQVEAGFNSSTLMTLRDRSYPETRLSNQELQLVVSDGEALLMERLNCDRDKALELLQACENELSKRLNKVQALKALSTQNQTSVPEDSQRDAQAKRRKT